MNIPGYYEDVSNRLTEVLDVSGLREDLRWWRINTWLQIEELDQLYMRIMGNTTTKVCMFGSQAEATTTFALFSDIDRVCVSTSEAVLRDLQFWEGSPDTENTFLMVADEGTPPGYVKLQLVETDAPILVNNYQSDKIHLDSKHRSVLLNNSAVIQVPIADEHHGPASTLYYMGMSMDIVQALQAHCWPDQASKWLASRVRRYNWPTRQMLDVIQQSGVMLVPVGHKLSSEQHLEWRLSFSYGEKLLTMKFNSTQYKCYVMLKYIKKTFLNIDLSEEMITSYHCKTCMFYLIENTPADLWRPNHLLFCIDLCLRQLLSWVKCKYCPNYFIPEENMFLGRNLGPVQGQIAGILNDLLGQKGRYLTRITYENIGENVVRVCQSLPMETVNPNKRALLITLMHLENILSFVTYSAASPSNVNLDAFKLSHGLRKEAVKIVMSLYSSGFGIHLASQSLEQDIPNQEKLTMAHDLFLWGTFSDVASGNLKLAAFYLALDNLEKMEEVLSHVDNKLTHDVIGVFGMSQYDGICSKIVHDDYSTAQFLQHHFCLGVIYGPSNIHSIPKAFILEMFRSTGSEISVNKVVAHWIPIVVVKSHVYLYFLQYQCFILQRRVVQSLVALCNMIWISQLELQRDECPNSISLELMSLTEVTTTLNLLAYCLKQGGRPMDAFKVLRKSMKIKKHHNAAKWQILNFISSTVRISNNRQN